MPSSITTSRLVRETRRRRLPRDIEATIIGAATGIIPDAEGPASVAVELRADAKAAVALAARVQFEGGAYVELHGHTKRVSFIHPTTSVAIGIRLPDGYSY